jgi:hypothetical protein
MTVDEVLFPHGRRICDIIQLKKWQPAGTQDNRKVVISDGIGAPETGLYRERVVLTLLASLRGIA